MPDKFSFSDWICAHEHICTSVRKCCTSDAPEALHCNGHMRSGSTQETLNAMGLSGVPDMPLAKAAERLLRDNPGCLLCSGSKSTGASR